MFPKPPRNDECSVTWQVIYTAGSIHSLWPQMQFVTLWVGCGFQKPLSWLWGPDEAHGKVSQHLNIPTTSLYTMQDSSMDYTFYHCSLLSTYGATKLINTMPSFPPLNHPVVVIVCPLWLIFIFLAGKRETSLYILQCWDGSLHRHSVLCLACCNNLMSG